MGLCTLTANVWVRVYMQAAQVYVHVRFSSYRFLLDAFVRFSGTVRAWRGTTPSLHLHGTLACCGLCPTAICKQLCRSIVAMVTLVC